MRDPIHGLIVFDEKSPLDQLVWRLLDAEEFQRLRRVRQLGFSEFVYPGATHSRFSHCIGVFHTARSLLHVIKKKIGRRFDENRARVALIAALLHDLGHGPFSHTFENVQKKRGVTKRHEKWTAEIIRGDTRVHEILSSFDGQLSSAVADLLEQEEPKDIYDSVVSSQFDADRLDYLRRDRYMTGIGTGGIDFDWLRDCIEIGKVSVGPAETGTTSQNSARVREVDGLYLNYKALQAAEAFLLARFHLYTQVYLHKTTRAAEQMLGALMAIVAGHVEERRFHRVGLDRSSPLVRYLLGASNNLSNYLALDDVAIWSALSGMKAAKDKVVRELAGRILERRLYKCLDVGRRAKDKGGDSQSRFENRLRERLNSFGLVEGVTVFSDSTKVSAYGVHEFGESDALHKVLLGRAGSDKTLDDIVKRSDLVKAIGEETIYRVYVPDKGGLGKLESLWREIAG